jgi:hypothetical protein
MIKTILLLLALVPTASTWSQKIISNDLDTQIETILKNPVSTSKYKLALGDNFKYLELPSNLGSRHIKNGSVINKLKKAEIKYVTYVYSNFKKAKDFNQQELNRNRLLSLNENLPKLFDNEKIKWKSVEQTGVKTVKQAKNLFHGFVVYYRPTPTKESMKAEITYFKKAVSTDLTPNTSANIESIEGAPIVEERKVEFLDYETEAGFTFPTGGGYTSKSILKYNYGNLFRDTTVAAVLNRNKHWNKILITCDLTGSMSPYSAQLFVWYKLNFDEKRIQHFVFFNDGNYTPDHLKKAGKTGGIYYSKASSFEEVEKSALKCMSNGYGGDALENDIEALLKGFKHCVSCNDVILIADNWANMRDYKLIRQLDRPVRIILCGAQLGINTILIIKRRIEGV